MACATCPHTDKPRATLVDGRECCTWCPEWRHETEARHILNLRPLAARRDYLYGALDRWGKYSGGLLQKRGEAAVKKMEATMTALWRRRVSGVEAQVPGRDQTPANDNEKGEENHGEIETA